MIQVAIDVFLKGDHLKKSVIPHHTKMKQPPVTPTISFIIHELLNLNWLADQNSHQWHCPLVNQSVQTASKLMSFSIQGEGKGLLKILIKKSVSFCQGQGYRDFIHLKKDVHFFINKVKVRE